MRIARMKEQREQYDSHEAQLPRIRMAKLFSLTYLEAAKVYNYIVWHVVGTNGTLLLLHHQYTKS